MNFWSKLALQKKPILCLAPMADVTDSAFRYIIAKHSKCMRARGTLASVPCERDSREHEEFFSRKISVQSEQDAPLGNNLISEEYLGFNYVTYTEFVSADGLVMAPERGRRKLLKSLEFSEIERPIVAQFFTSKPEMMEKAAQLAVELGFDGVDINMGCPDRSVEKQGAGAALIKDPKLAREIIQAAKQGASIAGLRLGLKNSQGRTFGLPVSIKTRLSNNKDELEEWLPHLLAENPAAIVIHARTRKEMSKVPARWERIKRAVDIRNNFWSQKDTSRSTDIFLFRRLQSGSRSHASALKNSSCSRQLRSQASSKRLSEAYSNEKTFIIGNGDILDIQHAYKLVEESGADGAMLGRAIFGRPYLFAPDFKWWSDKENKDARRKILEALVEHSRLFEEKFMSPNFPVKNFAIMKKHFRSYVSGFPEAHVLRENLMNCKNADEVSRVASEYDKMYN